MRPEKKTEAHELALVSPEDAYRTELNTNPDPDYQESFDWDSDPSVILHDQTATAAYFNERGELIVRQRDTLGEEGFLFIAPENIEQFLQGLGARATTQPTTRLKVVKE